MRWFSKEPVHFSNEDYATKLEDATPEQLLERQCLKLRTTVAASFGVAFSGLLVLPTLGLSLPGLALNLRTFNIAWRKRKIGKAEIDRRNLVSYKKRKRDFLIPTGISLALWSTIGIIDLFCFAGTSTAIASDAAGSALSVLSAMLHRPGDFLAAALQGFMFQGQQFVYMSGDQMGVNLSNLSAMLDAGGQQVVSDSLPISARPCDNVLAGSPPVPAGTPEALGSSQPSTGSATPQFATPTPRQGLENGFTPRGSGMAAQKADLAGNFHQMLASHHPGGHIEHVSAADTIINQAPHTGNEAQLAGLGVGMSTAQTTEKQLASMLIADNGILGVKKNITTSAGPPTACNTVSQEDARKVPKEALRVTYRRALTGEIPLPFMFLGSNGEPISQRIVTPPASDDCFDDMKKEVMHCHFCEKEVNAEKEAYYDCSHCSQSARAGFYICEPCVAGRGCSCTKERDHWLHRKGNLSDKVNFGQLKGMEKKEHASAGSDLGEVVTKRSKFKFWKKNKRAEELIRV